MTIAADLMERELLTIEDTDTVDRALEILARHDVRHVPVVDDAGRLVGMLGDRDLRAQGVATIDEVGGVDRLRARLSHRASELMARELVTVAPEDDVRTVLDRMIDSRHGALPVVDRMTGRLVGLISTVDVLRAVRTAMDRARRGPVQHASPSRAMPFGRAGRSAR